MELLTATLSHVPGPPSNLNLGMEEKSVSLGAKCIGWNPSIPTLSFLGSI